MMATPCCPKCWLEYHLGDEDVPCHAAVGAEGSSATPRPQVARPRCNVRTNCSLEHLLFGLKRVDGIGFRIPARGPVGS